MISEHGNLQYFVGAVAINIFGALQQANRFRLR